MITQLSAPAIAKPSNPSSSKLESTSSATKVDGGTQKASDFKSVFKQVHQANQPATKTVDSKANETNDLEEVQDVLQSESLEDLFGVLGLQMPSPSELESISLESLSDMLGLKMEEVREALKELLDVSELPNSLVDLVQLVEKQLPDVFAKLTEIISNDASASSKQLTQVMQVLKAAELILPKTDLLWKQELAVHQLKDMMKKLETAIEQLVPKEKSPTTQTTFSNWNQTNMTRTTEVHVVQKNAETQVIQKTVQQTEQNTNSVSGQLPQTKTETVTITLPTAKPAQAESFVKEFQSMMNRTQFGQAGGTTKMLIKLYPEHLGTIRVELISRDGVMSARLLANTSLGKEMLDSSLHQLKQAFHQQALQVDRIDVSQALQDSNRQEKQSFNGAFQQRSQEHESAQEDETNDDASFQDVLMEMEG